MNTLSLTTLQEKLPQIVDNILKTGNPVEVEVEYDGCKIMIIAVKSTQSVTERLKAQPLFTHEKVDFDTPTEWEWNEMKNL